MSVAPAVEPELYFAEPIVGWRVWRVLKIFTLRSGEQYRLAAVGTNGVPKLWEPRTAVRATCSAFTSRHEAPWPRHECGLYALQTREDAVERLEHWIAAEQGGKHVSAWALGQVSLWGRVVECQRGWRGEYAYPYAITVFANDKTIAVAIRNLYAVDVTAASGIRAGRLPLPAEVRLERKRASQQKASDEAQAGRARGGRASRVRCVAGSLGSAHNGQVHLQRGGGARRDADRGWRAERVAQVTPPGRAGRGLGLVR